MADCDSEDRVLSGEQADAYFETTQKEFHGNVDQFFDLLIGSEVRQPCALILKKMERPYKYIKIVCDVDKIDRAWRESEDGRYYIHPYRTIRTMGKDHSKYIASRKMLLNLEVTEPPIVLRKGWLDIFFHNGRHRFANLRDLGAVKIPILIKEDSYEDFKYYLYESE